jgi:hypothetical protein
MFKMYSCYYSNKKLKKISIPNFEMLKSVSPEPVEKEPLKKVLEIGPNKNEDILTKDILEYLSLEYPSFFYKTIN